MRATPVIRYCLRSVLIASNSHTVRLLNIGRTTRASTVMTTNNNMLSKIRRRMSGLGVSQRSGTSDQSAATDSTSQPTATDATPQATTAEDSPRTTVGEKDTKQTIAAPTATASAASEANASAAVPEAPEQKATHDLASSPPTHNYVAKDHLRTMYPALEPFKTGMLAVDDEHTLYWEASGNADGVPVVFLHGGPGGGCSSGDRRWFDPEHYCIYLVDQRGSGKSTPHASLNNNTTWTLVSDVEKLREHVGVSRWHVFGGSWGSCLALAYAQTHSDRVLSLVLRGIFTLRRSELLFFYQDGTSHIFPEYFAPYLEHIPAAEQNDLMAAYYKRLTSEDEAVQIEAAKHWSTWENATSKLYVDDEQVRKAESDAKWALAFARIECHFFVNRGWMDDGQLLRPENVDKIRHIPAVIVQGRYDCVCPAKTAFDLHKQWPEAGFHVVPDSGHASREIGIAHQLVQATDKMREIKP